MLYRWSLRSAGVLAAAASVTTFIAHRTQDQIKGTCEFSEHTRAQHQKHFISGMHAPFITKNEQALGLFYEHFDQFSHLLPTSVEKLQKQQALLTPVTISPLKDCPVSLSPDTCLLAIGGPPALISATAGLEAGQKVVYINDERRRPIANGSACHIEEDADQEAPTTYSPFTFMGNQILRALVKRESYEAIEKTGLYPWRTLDWAGQIKNPEQWLPAFKVFVGFQLKNMKGAAYRQSELDTVVAQCAHNERFFNRLNEKLGGKLLLDGTGAIIVARNQDELDALYSQKKNLAKEGRTFNILSGEDLKERFGFSFQGLAFADKTHDRVLSPCYKALLSDHIEQQGGTIIDGTLKTVYSDGQKPGGIAHYRTRDGQDHYLAFGQLLMSLGNQTIQDFNKKPLFDTIGATGSSGLAFVYTPVYYKLPQVAVFGGTNHVTRLSEPVTVKHEGQEKNLHLMRLTAGACITPTYRGEEGAHHDSTISLGLLSAVRKTLGEACTVQVLTLQGCNRVVSKHGQTTWIQPYPGIHIQFGAGGGGLTRAPDGVAHLATSETNDKRPRLR